MLFSVIVPIYNVEKYLDECVKSVLGQSFTDFELILVDDGSPDNCPQMCDDWAKKDSRVKVVHKQNGGLVSARKAGAVAAEGEYVINVDGDDFVADDLLEKMSLIICGHNPDLICYGYTPYGGNSQTPRINNCPTGIYTDAEFFRGTYLYNPDSEGINSGTLLFNVATKCVKRESYVASQNEVPNDIVSGEDTVFTKGLLMRVNVVYVSDYVGYFYRQNVASIEHQFNESKLFKLYRLYDVLNGIDVDGKMKQNAVDVYFFYRAWFYFCGLALKAKRFSEFKKSIRSCYDEKTSNDILARVKISRESWASKIKLRLLRKQKLRTIYFLARTYFKNRLGL